MAPVSKLQDEDDYSRALAEIALLFERPPEIGTPEAERFDLLAARIEAYEREHWPIDPSPQRRV